MKKEAIEGVKMEKQVETRLVSEDCITNASLMSELREPQSCSSPALPTSASNLAINTTATATAAVAPLGAQLNAHNKRKEKARIAARARRGQEASIILEMANELQITQDKIRKIDKATIVKLAIDYIKAFEILCRFRSSCEAALTANGSPQLITANESASNVRELVASASLSSCDNSSCCSRNSDESSCTQNSLAITSVGGRKDQPLNDSRVKNDCRSSSSSSSIMTEVIRESHALTETMPTPANIMTVAEQTQRPAPISITPPININPINNIKATRITTSRPSVAILSHQEGAEEEKEQQKQRGEKVPVKGPILSTGSIFAPKTEDMDSHFLMIDESDGGSSFVLKPDTEILDEDDLTHLAPQAGDISISLDVEPLEGIVLDTGLFSSGSPPTKKVPLLELAVGPRHVHYRHQQQQQQQQQQQHQTQQFINQNGYPPGVRNADWLGINNYYLGPIGTVD